MNLLNHISIDRTGVLLAADAEAVVREAYLVEGTHYCIGVEAGHMG